MALVQYRQFKGEIPAREPHLLPNGAAQLAVNCQFASGALVPAKGGQEVNEMVTAAIKGIYTETGLSFFTWADETFAFRSPIIDDDFQRVYFLTLAEGTIRATLSSGMSPTGGPPASGNAYQIGVPRPTAAPILALLDRTTLPDYPNAAVSFDVWYEDAGITYAKVSGSGYTTVTPFKKYSIPKPTRGTDVPKTAVIKVRMYIKEGSDEVVNTVVSPLSGTRLTSFPGSQEVTLSEGANLDLTITWGAEDTRAYIYVFENTWLEEGAPSPAALVSPTYLQDVTIKIGSANFAGYRPLLRANIYRTYGSSTSYVEASTSGSGTTYLDLSRSPSAIGSALVSLDWDPPPANMKGFCQMPGGIFAAFTGNSLYVSEPYRPHAWPYIFTLPTEVRGICAAQQSLVVTTADGLYILAGSAPSTAQIVKVPTPQPGLSQRSMVNIDGGVAYASRDGFALVDGSSASMKASQKLFGRTEWRKDFKQIMDDGSMRFSFQDGYLVVSSHTQAAGFTLRFDEDEGAMARHTQRMDCTFLLPIEDALYYSVDKKLYRYQAGTSLVSDWWGRDEIFPHHQVFGAGFLRAGGPVNVVLYAEGAKKFEATIQPGYFRIPDSFPRALRVSVRLTSLHPIYEFAIAQSMGELKNG